MPADFVFGKPGAYRVGMREIEAVDTSRRNRPVNITVWYPALRDPNASSKLPQWNAVPDPDNAPYPLILSSTKVANIIAPIVVSHGFTWASINDIDYYYQMNTEMIDQPRDILFALNRVASNPPDGLEGILDAEHAGAIGYSFDGYNALALSGARIDPVYYLAQCPTPDATTRSILAAQESAFGCAPANNWDAFQDNAGEPITVSQDGLWQPITDNRIRAVMPMAGEGWWLFGKKGLAFADRPTLMLVATNDGLYTENALIFEQLGAPDKALISFVGPDHLMIYDTAMVEQMAHFAVAFFGYHLQNRHDMAHYFSKDFVSQHENLVWGKYSDK